MTIPTLPPQFGKLVALWRSSTHEAERATARRKAEAILPPAAGGWDRALRILTYQAVRAAAGPNALFAGFDEYQEIDCPGYMARQAAERAAKLVAWNRRRIELVEQYGSLKAVEKPCDRERALQKALKPWVVRCDPPNQRWTREMRGWSSITLVEQMDPALRAAVEGALPMPATFAQARAELDYWRGRNDDLEHAMGKNGRFAGDYGLDSVCVVRMEIVRGLVDHAMPLDSLADILLRMKDYRSSDSGMNELVEDALIRDVEALVAEQRA